MDEVEHEVSEASVKCPVTGEQMLFLATVDAGFTHCPFCGQQLVE